MKVAPGKEERGGKSIIPFVVEDAQIKEISQEFFPDPVIREGEDWTCPICLRPHHREPGPLTYGATIHKKEGSVGLWVKSLGCCIWEQHFSLKELKEHQIKGSNLMPILRKHLYSR